MSLGNKFIKIFCLPWCLGALVVQLCFSSLVFAESFQLKLGKLFAEGRTVEMEAAVAARLKKEPGSPDLWLELADLRKSQGDYPGAALAYQKALSSKSDWKTSVGLALVWEQMGKFAEAEQSLTGLYKDHPDDPDILWGLARLRIYQSKWKSARTKSGALASPRDALEDAKKYLKKLTSLKPDFALATWQLAEVCRALGDTDLALESYEKVVRQDASYKLAHRHIAELLVQKGKIPGSLGQVRESRRR